MSLYNPKNRVSDALDSSFAHGTDTSLILTNASNFPSGGGYILVDDNTEWAIYEYTSISTNTLENLAQADAVNESTSAYTFASASNVYLVQAGDIISDVVDLLEGNTAFGNDLNLGDNSITNVSTFSQVPLSADPTDPDPGNFIMWVSDGTESGDAGDVMMKINVGGSTKAITLIDYSTH